MNITFYERNENNITIIDFIDQLGNKAGQLAFEIIDNKATIFNTFLYPYYQRKGILKSYIQTILLKIKDNRATIVELSVLNDDAKIAWARMGFVETSPNFFSINL